MSTARADAVKNKAVFRLLASILLLVPAGALGLALARPFLAQSPAQSVSFTLPDLHRAGAEISFPPQGEKGGAAIVSVFASWCAGCLIEHPLLLELKEKYALPIYGIAWRDEPEAARRWLARHKDPYAAVAYDQGGEKSRALGVTGTPETFVIDAEGRILYRHRGPLTADIAKNMIAPALASR